MDKILKFIHTTDATSVYYIKGCLMNKEFEEKTIYCKIKKYKLMGKYIIRSPEGGKRTLKLVSPVDNKGLPW